MLEHDEIQALNELLVQSKARLRKLAVQHGIELSDRDTRMTAVGLIVASGTFLGYPEAVTTILTAIFDEIKREAKP